MPRTDLCHVKTLNITEAQPDPMPDTRRERIDHSDIILPSVRSMRFNEIEFSMPEEEGPDDLVEVRDLLMKKFTDVAMPLEYRTVGQDDIYISPAQGRDTITLSAHRTARYPFADFFKEVEDIHRNHNGRPHWGKVHTHTAEELAPLYPLWDTFLNIRKEIDPNGMFLNDHLKSLFI